MSDYFTQRTAGLPVVLAIPHDLTSVLQGRPVVFTITLPDGINEAMIRTGDEVVIRLPTVDEFLLGHERACASLNVPTTLTQERAAVLVKPLTP